MLAPAGLRSAGPVGADGSQAAGQIVAEGAQLNQCQVGRHLGLVVTGETGSCIPSKSFSAVPIQANRLRHL